MVSAELVRKAISFLKDEMRPAHRKGQTKNGSNLHGGDADPLEKTLTHGPCSIRGSNTCPGLKIGEHGGKLYVRCDWGASPNMFWFPGDYPKAGEEKPPTLCAIRAMRDTSLTSGSS